MVLYRALTDFTSSRSSNLKKVHPSFWNFWSLGLFAYGFLSWDFFKHNLYMSCQLSSQWLPLFFILSLQWFGALDNSWFLGSPPLAASISLWLSVLMLAFNVNCARSFECTWEGFSFESFDYIVTSLKLVVPSATMEWEDWCQTLQKPLHYLQCRKLL